MFNGSIANGISAQRVVKVVMRIGLNFWIHASITLSIEIISSELTLSYKMIALFTEVPNKTTRAMMLFTFIDLPKIISEKNAPEKAGGIAIKTRTGIKKLSNCAPITQ